MFLAPLYPVLSAIALLIVATGLGVPAMRRLVMIYEAKHELKHGSAGWLRSLRGWSLVALWLMLTWFLATIIGDWAVSGDLDRAVERSWLRLRVLLDLAILLMSSDG